MRQFFLVLAVSTFCVCRIHAAAETELKAVHSVIVEAARTGNIDVLEANIHPQALGFLRESQFPVQLGASYGVREFIPSLLADLSRFLVANYDSVFRIVGDTGIVCTINKATPVAPDPKTGKKGKPAYNRAIWIYANLNGKWKMVAWHTSELPLKK